MLNPLHFFLILKNAISKRFFFLRYVRLKIWIVSNVRRFLRRISERVCFGAGTTGKKYRKSVVSEKTKNGGARYKLLQQPNLDRAVTYILELIYCKVEMDSYTLQ